MYSKCKVRQKIIDSDKDEIYRLMTSRIVPSLYEEIRQFDAN